MKYEEKIKQAELDKLIAETDKTRAEIENLEKERKQLDKPLYKKLNFLKTVVAGLVGGLAILGVFKSIIEPTYKKDIIKTELEIAKKEKKIFELNDSVQFAKKDIKGLEEKNSNTLKEIELEKANKLFLLDSIKKYEQKVKNREQSIVFQKKQTIEIINDQLKYLKGLNEENRIHIQSIYFKYDKSNISNDQVTQLDMVVKFLKQNNEFSIEVRGYSFEKGKKAYNQLLSERRARKVVGYLINQGISPARITSKGMGETDMHPIIVNRLDREIEQKLYELKAVVQISLVY